MVNVKSSFKLKMVSLVSRKVNGYNSNQKTFYNFRTRITFSQVFEKIFQLSLLVQNSVATCVLLRGKSSSLLLWHSISMINSPEIWRE